MAGKKDIIPFKLKKKVTRKKKKEDIIDEGTLNDLKYKIYSRGVIHLFDTQEKFLFKKNCELFDKALNELNLNSLTEGKYRKIPGSGDNDTLVFTCKNGDITISLERPEYGMIATLKGILKKGVKKDTEEGDR